MRNTYYPGKELSLDESMMLWRGRLVFRQYIKNKRHKFGIKLYMLTEPSGTLLEVEVYTGAMDSKGGKGHASKVVMKLLQHKLNSGHSVYMDNYYNSCTLARELLDNQTFCTGTLRADRKGNPKDVVATKLPKGGTKAKYSNGIMIGKWKDKRDVLYISTEFPNTMVTFTKKRAQEKVKPLPILNYNKFMSGVDRQDQMMAYYPCSRKTLRWYKKLAIHFFQLILVNSHYMFNEYSGKRLTFYDYRLEVIRGLLGASLSKPKAPAIRIEDEKRLAEGLKTMERWGFGISRKEILHIVADFITKNKTKTPFTNNIPGNEWFHNFKNRHRLSIKKPQAVAFFRRKMTDPFVIYEYFDLLNKTLSDFNLHDKPELIWNLDETSLSQDPHKTRAVGERGEPSSRTSSGPASPNGWIEANICFNYFEKTLIPALGPTRPVLIIYDGYSTHVNIPLIELARDNDVTILKLTPHSSHLLQPLNLSVFKSVKDRWDLKLVTWQRKNIGHKIPKKVFSELIGETWKDLDTEIIRNSFKKAGIHPFNRHVIPDDKYHPEALK
ncbi:hypothetical protein NQ314_021391, partial [Rhamnusium bicolor]